MGEFCALIFGLRGSKNLAVPIYDVRRLDLQILGNDMKKPGTGNPLHTQEPVTVASFRTWRGWRERVARDRYLTLSSLPSVAGTNVPFPCAAG
jgi:hypothetical protein